MAYRFLLAVVFALALAVASSGCVSTSEFPVGSLETNRELKRYADAFRQYRQSPGDEGVEAHLVHFGKVFERVKRLYVEPVADGDLVDNAIKGLREHSNRPGETSDQALTEAALKQMLSGLDRGSAYLASDLIRKRNRGAASVGLNATVADNALRVIAVFDNSPAARAGLRTGDFVTHIDNEPVQEFSLAENVHKFRGPENSSVVFTVRRQKGPPFDLKIKREIIRLESVKWRIEQNVGFLRIGMFGTDAAEKTEHALRKMVVPGPDNIQGLIVDLRNNPGGLLEEVVKSSDLFLQRGRILSRRGRDNRDDVDRNAKPGDLTSGMVIIVLINGGTASGAEMMAAALKDNGRATLLGTRTAGFGAIQTVLPIPGHRDGIKLTTSFVMTPAGKRIEGDGVQPDILFENMGMDNEQVLIRAVEIINARAGS